MKLLQELLEMQLLVEDFGNLNFINKKFQPALKFSAKLNYEDGGNILKKFKEIPMALGREAIVENIPFKSATDVEKYLKQENMFAFVIEANGNQVCLIRSYNVDNSTPPRLGFEIFLDTDLIEQNISDKINSSQIEEYLNKIKYIKLSQIGHYSIGYNNMIISSSAVYSQIGTLIKILKLTNLNKDFKVYAIFPDKNKITTRKKRMERKRASDERALWGLPGSTSFPLQLRPGESKLLDDNLYYPKAKEALMIRLQDYKKEHAVDLSDINEMIDLIKKKGFLHNIKIKGIPYKLYSQNYMNVDNFTDKSKNKPNLIYQVDRHDEEFEKVKKKASYLKDLYDDPDEHRAAYKKFMPPEYIKIELKFGPGGIVPSKVEGTDSSW